MPRHRGRWLPILVVGAVVAACTGCGPSTTAPGGHPGRASGASQFSATGPNGSPVAVPGGRPAVIYFFTTGCSQGAPAVAAAHRHMPSATYVAVDLDPGATTADARSVLRAAGAANLAVSTDASIVARYGISTVGTTVVLDAGGRAVYTGVEASTSQIGAAVATARQST